MEQTRKHSRKRDAILSCLRSTTCHPTAEWIYQQLKPEIPDLSLGTVYRNLALFKKEGLIDSVGTVDGLERFDGNRAPHAHLVCTCCHAVLDCFNLELPETVFASARAQTGARIDGCKLVFTGLCESCQKK